MCIRDRPYRITTRSNTSIVVAAVVVAAVVLVVVVVVAELFFRSYIDRYVRVSN